MTTDIFLNMPIVPYPKCLIPYLFLHYSTKLKFVPSQPFWGCLPIL